MYIGASIAPEAIRPKPQRAPFLLRERCMAGFTRQTQRGVAPAQADGAFHNAQRRHELPHTAHGINPLFHIYNLELHSSNNVL